MITPLLALEIIVKVSYTGMTHTIVLVQFTSSTDSRKYYDFPAVKEAMTGVVRVYEEDLKRLNPSMMELKYTVDEFFEYLDDLGDISCLVFEKETATYGPHGLEWIKKGVYSVLETLATQVK